VSNAVHWIDEYHLDGLRFDATQTIFDRSPEHVLAEMARRTRAVASPRSIILVGENEAQTCRLVQRAEEGGYGLDALWNDDYHHSALVALTGHREAYYTDYLGQPQEFVAAAKYGYLYQGQRYAWQKKNRGTPAWGLKPAAFVTYLENHDQLANSDSGRRMHQLTSPGRYRAAMALTLLGPGTPLLFQGQEFGATTPFLFFADHNPELAAAVRKGRAAFLQQFPSLTTSGTTARLAPPEDEQTFQRSKLDWTEFDRHGEWRRFHAELLALRRDERAFSPPSRCDVDGAVLSADAFAFRFFCERAEDERLLIVNLGADLEAGSFAEPLVAPPADCCWVAHWSSEAPEYGGGGTPGVVASEGWLIPGHSAIVLRPEKTDGGDGTARD
jgi:maltooligosyltrehalose trehalohydrolase